MQWYTVTNATIQIAIDLDPKFICHLFLAYKLLKLLTPPNCHFNNRRLNTFLNMLTALLHNTMQLQFNKTQITDNKNQHNFQTQFVSSKSLTFKSQAPQKTELESCITENSDISL